MEQYPPSAIISNGNMSSNGGFTNPNSGLDLLTRAALSCIDSNTNANTHTTATKSANKKQTPSTSVQVSRNSVSPNQVFTPTAKAGEQVQYARIPRTTLPPLSVQPSIQQQLLLQQQMAQQQQQQQPQVVQASTAQHADFGEAGQFQNGFPPMTADARLYITTYQTVRREEYLPGGKLNQKQRPIAQDHILAPSVYELPADLREIISDRNWPLVRIGEQFKVIFTPVTGGGILSRSVSTGMLRSTILTARGQQAVRVRANFVTRPNAPTYKHYDRFQSLVSIETTFWDPKARLSKCLRCANAVGLCSCPYANDLLLPVKKTECQILPEANGAVGLLVRIPRTRASPSIEERRLGKIRSNAWLRRLPTSGHGHARTPKLMLVCVTEELIGLSPDGDEVLEKKLYWGCVRLVAKNGGIREKAVLNGDLSPTAVNPSKRPLKSESPPGFLWPSPTESAALDSENFIFCHCGKQFAGALALARHKVGCASKTPTPRQSTLVYRGFATPEEDLQRNEAMPVANTKMSAMAPPPANSISAKVATNRSLFEHNSSDGEGQGDQLAEPLPGANLSRNLVSDFQGIIKNEGNNANRKRRLSSDSSESSKYARTTPKYARPNSDLKPHPNYSRPNSREMRPSSREMESPLGSMAVLGSPGSVRSPTEKQITSSWPHPLSVEKTPMEKSLPTRSTMKVCPCGRVLANAQALGGHRNFCKVPYPQGHHLFSAGGSSST
eukprot:m.33340 g.33340  ORF g.33340 m.33340 type:complete len:726 (+) comp8518_c0_seq2:240-2417(+)